MLNKRHFRVCRQGVSFIEMQKPPSSKMMITLSDREKKNLENHQKRAAEKQRREFTAYFGAEYVPKSCPP
jgi:hypothetical protein